MNEIFTISSSFFKIITKRAINSNDLNQIIAFVIPKSIFQNKMLQQIRCETKIITRCPEKSGDVFLTYF